MKIDSPARVSRFKVVHATLLQIQAEWAAEIGPDRFRDFMAALRTFAARGGETG